MSLSHNFVYIYMNNHKLNLIFHSFLNSPYSELYIPLLKLLMAETTKLLNFANNAAYLVLSSVYTKNFLS